MELLPLICVVVLLMAAIVTLAGGAPSREQGPRLAGPFEPRRTRFRPPMPKGYRVFTGRLGVSGLHYRKHDAIRFVTASAQSLRLVHERTPRDPNAIKVIGVFGPEELFIGYVPAHVSEQIVGTGLVAHVKPRLLSTFSGGQYADVEFQVIGPNSLKSRFDDYVKRPRP